jgi:quinoprotein dehydrogenase-associated probable ABC transporter substrate-binding protein
MLRIARCALAILAASAAAGPSRAASGRQLRVCADPNNLPFSNEHEEGLENFIARVVARDLHADLVYTWLPQRRGFVRNTLSAKRCDVMMEVPAGYGRTLSTQPYYRSTYVFVSRKDRGLAIRSLDDPALRGLRIGVQMVGDDYANTPPAHALGRRGLAKNVVGYTVYGDYSRPDPQAEIVHAVARGDIDVAIVWGPIAGYFAPRENVPLVLTPVSPQVDPPFRFSFDIAMGVRRGDAALQKELEQVIQRRRGEIDSILVRFGVPRAPEPR